MRGKKQKGEGSNKREVLIVISLLIIAFVLRLIYLSHLKANDPNFLQPPPGTDMLTYHNFAKQIANGTFGKDPYYYGPLYFYFLAIIYKIFGIDAGIARFFQMILGVLTTFLTYLIAKKVFNKTVGYISLIISILYGMFYIHEGILLMESLATFLNILTLFLLLKVKDNPSYKNLTFSGISLGLSALTRANILLFVPFILIWMLFNSKLKTQNSKLLKYGFLCLITLLTISPATIRNYLTSGKFVLISTNGPVNLWIGNNPYASGKMEYPHLFYSQKVGEKVNKEGDSAYLKEVLQFIKNNPNKFFLLLFKKFLMFWSKEEIPNNITISIQKGFSSFLFRFILILGFGIVAPLSIIGIFLSVRGWKRYLSLYLFIFAFMIGTVIFFVLARYRIGVIPILIIFAGFSIFWWYERIRRKEFSIFFSSLILLVLSFGLVYAQSATNVLYSKINSQGIVVDIPDRIIFRDDRDTHGKDFNLNIPIKKEIIVEEDSFNFKEALLFFFFNGENNPGVLNISINNERLDALLQPTSGLFSSALIKFSPSWLKKGINTIILRPKGKVKASIGIDLSYSFGRSYFLNQLSEWERLKKGEYMIRLELLK